MAYYDFQNGQNQERLQGQVGVLRARHDAADADRNAAAWQRHAQKLEDRLQALTQELQQARDNERAIRTVNDVHRETLRTVQAQLGAVSPGHGFADVESVKTACRAEIDRRLGLVGLAIDRSDPINDRVVRK